MVVRGKQHHVARRVPQDKNPPDQVTLSSDDPGIWGARGLTHDFWEA